MLMRRENIEQLGLDFENVRHRSRTLRLPLRKYALVVNQDFAS
ncbi:hypothetical protein I546_5875 [Mycobacterium kansasii 732]|nr:hypothetical protein I546_5875 [Mycobacterium kansasii 732]